MISEETQKNGVQKSSFLGFNRKKSTTKQRSQNPPQPQPSKAPELVVSPPHLPQATRDELHEALKDAKVVSKEKREKLSEALRSVDEIGKMGVMGVVVLGPLGLWDPKIPKWPEITAYTWS